MIEFFRKKSKEILFVIALIFIGGIFFMYKGQKAVTALKVNGKKISYEEFNKTFTRALNNERDSSEEGLSEDDIMRIKQRVLSGMVQDELILQEAKKLGLRIPDEVIANTIMSMKSFQRDGNFIEELYERVLLSYYRMQRYEFEEDLRRSIKTQFFRGIILASSKTSPVELEMEFKKRFPEENFDEKKTEFKNTVLNEKRSLIYYGWMNHLINNSKIVNNLPALEKQQSGG